jgi:glycosyltransferase involved in cell wall biosynthesis
MRILHIVYSLSTGGTERAVANYLIAMKQLGTDARLAVLNSPAGTSYERELAEADIDVHYLNKGSGFRPGIYGKLRRMIADFRPQVVHTHLNMLRYALPPALAARVPVLVHTIHGKASSESRGAGGLELALRRWVFGRRVTPVAVSDYVAEGARAFYGLPNCAVIQNGINTTRFAPESGDRQAYRQDLRIGDDETVFICVARLTPVKRHAALIESFAQALKTVPDCRLLLVGGGRLEQEITEQVRRLGLSDRISLLGNRNDVPQLLWAADVAVLASEREGFGMTLIEAMAAGLPVVCTDGGATAEIVKDGETGFVRAVSDGAGFAQAMTQLAQSTSLRQKMGVSAHRRAQENFDSAVCGQRYLDLYASLLPS